MTNHRTIPADIIKDDSEIKIEESPHSIFADENMPNSDASRQLRKLAEDEEDEDDDSKVVLIVFGVLIGLLLIAGVVMWCHVNSTENMFDETIDKQHLMEMRNRQIAY